MRNTYPPRSCDRGSDDRRGIFVDHEESVDGLIQRPEAHCLDVVIDFNHAVSPCQCEPSLDVGQLTVLLTSSVLALSAPVESTAVSAK